MLLVTLLLGLVIGAIMGALGGGGAILAIPVLVYVLHQSPQAATTSSLIVVGIGAIVGMLHNLRARCVRIGQAVVFGLVGIVGNVVGTLLSRGVDEKLLMTLFAGLLFVVAGVMAQRLRRAQTSGSGALPLTEVIRSPRRLGLLVLAATIPGLFTGFFGVSGGFMIVPALVLVLGFPIEEAVGSSLLVIAMNCLIAFLSRLGHPLQVDWPLTATLATASVIGTLLGTRIAGKADTRTLNLAFIILLLAIASYTLLRTWA